ncbi:olfactory receptor 5V1-like [Pleurodeles waltl]|uniref:olfactory receptor 5V1-like n=1 Tax=Pleurodeles waltl TaxID=8319 RepID=UPI0037099ADC
MDDMNQTRVTEFILMGLSDQPDLQPALFTVFLLMYSVGLLGNGTIIKVICAADQLHTPMYFFIGSLSLVDICLTTVTVPSHLIHILSQRRTISYRNCITQLFFFTMFVGIESFLLGVMAYDRYIAICNPLHYLLMMTKRACVLLVASSWSVGLLNAFLHTMMLAVLPFCSSNQIQSFFCDIPPMLKLSCSDTSANELLLFTEVFFLVLVSIVLIVVSYFRIISTILKIQSREGRHQAFSTCSSHLVVVTLYYGTTLFIYIRPSSSYSLNKDKMVTVMYTVIIPMLNPFIYSLRNKQVKGALGKALGRNILCHKS